jgi:hypothetical protein
VVRPLSLKTDVIKKRYVLRFMRLSMLACSWLGAHATCFPTVQESRVGHAFDWP